MKNRLQGSAGLIVGVNSDVGFAIAQELAERGVTRITGTFLPKDKDTGVGIDNVIRRLAGVTDFKALELDQTDDAQVQAVIAEAQRNMNGLDLLITAASLQSEKSQLEIPFDEMQAQAMVNLVGTMNVIRRVLANSMIPLADKEAPDFHHRSIGVVASIRGVEPLLDHMYDAAKAGLIHHVRALAKSIGPHGISINGVAPGTINCPIEYLRHDCSQAEYEKRWEPLTPLGGKPVSPGDVAEELANLMNSRSVTGQVVNVDGGFGNMRPLPERAKE